MANSRLKKKKCRNDYRALGICSVFKSNSEATDVTVGHMKVYVPDSMGSESLSLSAFSRGSNPCRVAG